MIILDSLVTGFVSPQPVVYSYASITLQFSVDQFLSIVYIHLIKSVRACNFDSI